MDDEMARQVLQGSMDPAHQGLLHFQDAVLIEEPCPHCRVALQLSVERDSAHQGFLCPECGKGLIRMRHVGSKVLALCGVTFSVAIFGALSLLSLVGLWRCVEQLLEVEELFGINLVFLLGTLGFAVLCLIMCRVTSANLRVGWRVLRGARLLPAVQTGGAYHYEATPLRFKFRRSKGGETLAGAVSLSRQAEHGTLEGALSQKPSPHDP